jgi:hypothetical protein
MERRAVVKGELLCNQQHSRDAWADFRIPVRRHRRLFRIHSIFKTMVMLFLLQKRSLIPVSAQLNISFVRSGFSISLKDPAQHGILRNRRALSANVAAVAM